MIKGWSLNEWVEHNKTFLEEHFIGSNPELTEEEIVDIEHNGAFQQFCENLFKIFNCGMIENE